MNKSSPNQFIVIIDKNGDPSEMICRQISMQNIRSILEQNDKSKSWAGPHSAMLWNGACWYHFKV